MATAQVSWLDVIPGARQGVSYLLGQVAKFQRLPVRFQAIETTAITAKRQAEQRGKLAEATQLALALQGLATMREKHQRTSVRLADVIEGLRTAGLGITPVELGLLAASVATEVAAIFTGTDGVEATVLGAARKVLSPEEVARLAAAAPRAPLARAGGAMAALVAVGFTVFLLATRRPARRRARR